MDLLKVFSNKDAKDIACDRLKLILIHDRADVAPDLLENIKSDLLDVVSKYVEIDTKEVEIKITTTEVIEGAAPALIASIPIKNIK